MVTGDAPATARVVADAVGLTGPVGATVPPPHDIGAEDFGVFAGVFCLDAVKVMLFRRLAIACAGSGLHQPRPAHPPITVDGLRERRRSRSSRPLSRW